MDDDLVTHREVLDVRAHGVDDPGRVAPADVEVLVLPLAVAHRDHVDGNATGSPDVVEIDARRHHCKQDLVGFDRRGRWWSFPGDSAGTVLRGRTHRLTKRRYARYGTFVQQ
jgi:hypothetical protein